MKITPLDIRQKQLGTAFRGLDPKEVEGFLELIATEFEDLVRENVALKEDQRRKQERIDEYRDHEKTLQETMVTAQRISEEVKAQAKKEAEIIVANSELQADRIIAEANHRLVAIIQDINEVKRQRIQFESELKSILEAHQKLLEMTRSAASVKVEEKVSYLAAKKAAE